MKKTALYILHRFASIFGWKWLYFLAGIGLMTSIQSCKKKPIHKCYSPVKVDPEFEEPRCYDRAEPADTSGIIEHDENTK